MSTDRILYLAFLVPFLPLAGAFINTMAALMLAGLAWAALLGVIFNLQDDPQKWLFVAQIPFLLLVTWIAFVKAKRPAEAYESDDNPEEKKFIELQSNHRFLKEAVLKGEKHESLSLAIYGAAKGWAEALSWKDLAPRITSSIQKVFGGYEFLLFAIDEQGQRTLLQRRGSWSQDFPLDHVPISGLVLSPPQSSEVVPVLAIPIYTGNADERHMNGLFLLKQPSKDRTDQELIEIGAEFAEHLGMTLGKALLFSQMERHSQMDGLTGLYRRQAFMDRLEQEFKRAAVFHTPFSLMMVDIDFFKHINDSHGHEAGDLVLKRVSELLRTSVYETDVVGRYGGEEFIILLPRAERDGVLRKAEQLRHRIETEVIPFGFEQLNLTISIGVAHYPTGGNSPDSLIAAADKALYQAKETGRNRVLEG